mgnify:CR=1 FL=1
MRTTIVALTCAMVLGGSAAVVAAEEAVTIENEGDVVFGVWATPEAVEGEAPAVLLLHGFTGMREEGTVFDADGNELYTMYGHTADALADAGIASLRIDFRGSGESIEQMCFEGTTFSGQVSDALAAIDWLEAQEGIGPIGVLGLSQGGLVGSITAASSDAVESLVLWSPVANPVDTYKTVLGAEAVAAGLDQPVTDATLPWGDVVTLEQPFYQELYTTDPLVAVSHFDGPLQVVVGAGDLVVTPQPWYGESYMAAHEGDEELVVVEGDHVFDVFAGNGAPGLDDAVAESVDWFVSTLQ